MSKPLDVSILQKVIVYCRFIGGYGKLKILLLIGTKNREAYIINFLNLRKINSRGMAQANK